MQVEDLKQLLDQVNQSMVTPRDIFVVIVINILLIIVIKLIFMFITSFSSKTNYGKKVRRLGHIALKEKATKSELQELHKAFASFINYSSMIGFVERILYVYAILTNQVQLLALIIAVKTIVRFPEINKQTNNDVSPEKYILGTLLNILFAIWIVQLIKY